MFSDNEDELELLRQYEKEDINNGYSSDEMDSETEDRIMSMVQFGCGLNKKYIPTEGTERDDESDNSSESDEEDIGVVENRSVKEKKSVSVTRYIHLGENYMDDKEITKEEPEHGLTLKDLIDDHDNKKVVNRHYEHRRPKICFACYKPGHERKDCNLCDICGAAKHHEGRCIGSRYCVRCKLRGHNAADCENDRVHSSCSICHTSYHHALNCPSLLHQYVNEQPASRTPIAYCYNCANKGHYGDECPDLPSRLSTMPSEFSYMSIYEGSRFDSKKTMKRSASSFGVQQQSNHHRWAENSLRPGYSNDRSYNDNKHQKYDDFNSDYSSRMNNRYNDRSYNDNKHQKYNDFNSDYSSRKSNRYNERYDNGESSYSNDNRREVKKASSYKDNNAGGKRHRTSMSAPYVQPSRSGTIDFNK